MTEITEELAGALVERIVAPIEARWRRRLDERASDARTLIGLLLAGRDPLAALQELADFQKDADLARRDAIMDAAVNGGPGPDDDEQTRPSVGLLWPQAWRRWDATRPERIGLVNPYVPQIEYGKVRPGLWLVAEHLLDALDEWHPGAELAELGRRYTKLSGADTQAAVLEVANANLGRVKPERSTGSPVQYRLVVSDELPPPLPNITWDRDLRKSVVNPDGSVWDRGRWHEDHLVTLAVRLRKANRR